MLERLVKPILEIWEEMKISDDEIAKIDKKIKAKQARYETEMKPLQKELDTYKNKSYQLREKQVTMRKQLGNQLIRAKCGMTIVEVEMKGETKPYGIYSDGGTVTIREIEKTKEVEKKIAVNKLEKSKWEIMSKKARKKPSYKKP